MCEDHQLSLGIVLIYIVKVDLFRVAEICDEVMNKHYVDVKEPCLLRCLFFTWTGGTACRLVTVSSGSD